MKLDRATLTAIIQALRAIYVMITVLLVVSYLAPFLGVRDYFEERLGRDGWLNLAIGWGLLGVLVEHLRSSALQGQISYLARILRRISPDLKKREAVKILVRALSSEDESVVDTAHRELKRITQTELGRNPAEWHRWLAQQEKKPERTEG